MDKLRKQFASETHKWDDFHSHISTYIYKDEYIQWLESKLSARPAVVDNALRDRLKAAIKEAHRELQDQRDLLTICQDADPAYSFNKQFIAGMEKVLEIFEKLLEVEK